MESGSDHHDKGKTDNKHNLSNYRPISLTNSDIKLIEKLIKTRLTNFLNNKYKLPWKIFKK